MDADNGVAGPTAGEHTCTPASEKSRSSIPSSRNEAADRITNKAALGLLAAVLDLRNRMRGEIILPGADAYDLPGADDYDRLRSVFNGAIDHAPALIARCETSKDVEAAVKMAREHGLRLSVRGGGHDWAGRAIRPGGLVIDLSRMRTVEVDPGAQIATFSGGATAADVIAAAGPYGLAAATGTAGSVGMAGLTLGGGYGPLLAAHGLALDNLLGVEIVLANGQRITADARQNPELFWAVRGGGGNFGVVTSLKVRLHLASQVRTGLILFPLAEAERVLRGYVEMARLASDALTVWSGILSGPDGTPVLFLAPTWSGETKAGEEAIAALCLLGTPVFNNVSLTTYEEMLRSLDASVISGRHYEIRNRWLPELTAEAVSMLIAAGRAMTSPFSIILLHHFRGAPMRVPPDATAFGLRREHFLIESIAAWEPEPIDRSAEHRRWAQNLSCALAPIALPGGYANLLGPDDREQIAYAYGGNLARLQDIKRRFDPDHVFSAIPLPDSGTDDHIEADSSE
jgi:FAD/FMN-containing dehydrogenase